MDLTNIITDRASAETKFMGEVLKFKYRPGMVTAEAMNTLQSIDDLDTLGTFLAQIIVSWDLTKNGKDIPVEPEVFSTLPLHLIRGIVATIMEDIPQGESGKA